MNQYIVLRWPCAYDNCPEILNDIEHNINRKYCVTHQKIRVKEQNKVKIFTNIDMLRLSGQAKS